jgi:NAD(P)-dependent dehydrogenase (short-subunit alcohol dehydrogenase family)
VPALLRRPAPRRGRFIAVASAAATRGMPMLAAYSAAKAGVAASSARSRRNLAAPASPRTRSARGPRPPPALDESARLYALPAAESFAIQQPLGRLLRPEEVAAVIAFLAGEDASGMTGAIVPVDGGLAL